MDLSTLKAKRAEIAKQEAELLKESEKLFKKAVKDLFKENPTLESFSWTQYTPYFNDGDTCTFSANTDYPDVNDISEYDDDGEGRKYDEELAKNVTSFLSNFNEDDYESMFGDHVKVTITKDGKIDVSDYSHD